MHKIKITKSNNNYTLVQNLFIDEYMYEANGEFVKIYLVLLRLMGEEHLLFSPSDIADKLNLTESDVIRAINYWESKQVLSVDREDGHILSISFCTLLHKQPLSTIEDSVNKASLYTPKKLEDSLPTSNKKDVVPENTPITKAIKDKKHMNFMSRPQYTKDEFSKFTDDDNYQQLIYITGRYLGKALSQTEVGQIISFNDWLGLPFDVIEFLIDYCVSNNHRHMHYIEKVAIDWADKGINTLAKAKLQTEVFNKKYYAIKKALGFSGRDPVAYEMDIMDKWIDTYQLEMDIILEACQRTMKHAPNGGFNYADKIITSWYKNGVHSLSDIHSLDQQHNKKKSDKVQATKHTKSNKPHNKFNNYNQRVYDFDSIEKRAIELQMKETSKGGYK